MTIPGAGSAAGKAAKALAGKAAASAAPTAATTAASTAVPSPALRAGVPGSGAGRGGPLRDAVAGSGRGAATSSPVPDGAGAPVERRPADVLGRVAGAAGADRPQSLREDVKSSAGDVVRGAASGAVQGAVVGGGLPGAAAGAAKGAGAALLSSRVGRRGLRIAAGVVAFVLVASLVAQLNAVNQITSALAGADAQSSIEAAHAQGQSDDEVQAARTLTAGSGIPWQIALAYSSTSEGELDVPSLVGALDAADPNGRYRDIGAGSVYSSASVERTIGTSDEAQAAAATVKKLWVAALQTGTGLDEDLAEKVYDQGLRWYLGAAVASCTLTDVPDIPALDEEQAQIAKQIMDAATALGLPQEAQIVGVMTGLGESGLHNIDYGDKVGPDSRGVFQQRDSWGPLADRMDPFKAATAFFTRLKGVAGWQTMEPTLAAHKVQRNADPNHYTKWLPQAQTIVAGLSGTALGCTGSRASGDDYPWPTEKTVKEGGSLSPLRYYYRECVDFVAWRLNRDAGITSAPWKYTWANLTPTGGNAKDWKPAWERHGWKVSSTPVPGAVAWFGTKAGKFGHVGYVQAVNDDGTILMEEYNWGGKHMYGSRTVKVGYPDAYLYPPGGASS